MQIRHTGLTAGLNANQEGINMAGNRKGSRRERELIDKLTKEGYIVHRVAASGAKNEAVCDLVAVKEGVPYFIECKARKKAYYPNENKEQLKKLAQIANSCRAIPLLAIKLDRKEWEIKEL